MSGEHPSLTTNGSKREQNDFQKKNSLRAVFFAYLQVFFLLPESVKFMIFDNQLAYCKLVS